MSPLLSNIVRAVTGIELSSNDWHCQHKTPYHLTRDDSYGNLMILHESVHRLIHMKNHEKIEVLLNALKLDTKQLQKLTYHYNIRFLR